MRRVLFPKLAKPDVSHGKYLVIMRLPWAINTCDSAKQERSESCLQRFPCVSGYILFIFHQDTFFLLVLHQTSSLLLASVSSVLCLIMEASQAKTFQKLKLKHGNKPSK